MEQERSLTKCPYCLEMVSARELREHRARVRAARIPKEKVR